MMDNNNNNVDYGVSNIIIPGVDNDTTEGDVLPPQQIKFQAVQKLIPQQQQQLLVIATRIHMGESSNNINATVIQQQMEQYYNFCYSCYKNINSNNINNTHQKSDMNTVVRGVIAVDVTNNHDLIDIVRTSLHDIAIRTTTDNNIPWEIDIIPVQPWGKFTPALNALLSYASNTLRTLVSTTTTTTTSTTTTAAVVTGIEGTITTAASPVVGGCILYCSLETTSSSNNIDSSTSSSSPSSNNAIRTLFQYMDYNTTLVCGAVLPGHDYKNQQNQNHTSCTTTTTATKTEKATPITTILNGRTTPWNTFALWNINKLSKIGFITVSDGLPVDLITTSTTNTTSNNSIAGIEEVVTIALLQKLYNPHTTMMAKLIHLQQQSIIWDVTTSTTIDIKRQQWHEYKMQSKLQRAQTQLQLLSLLPTPTSDSENSNSTVILEPSSIGESSWLQQPGIVYHY